MGCHIVDKQFFSKKYLIICDTQSMFISFYLSNTCASRFNDNNLYLENDQLCAARGFDDRDLIIRHEEVYTNRPSHIYPIQRHSRRDNFGDDERLYDRRNEPFYDRSFRPNECDQRKCLFNENDCFRNYSDSRYNPNVGRYNENNEGRNLENRDRRVYDDYYEPRRNDRFRNNDDSYNQICENNRNERERPRRRKCLRCH